jgi:hypothetical protein
MESFDLTEPGLWMTYFMKLELSIFFLGCTSLVIIILYRIFLLDHDPPCLRAS